MYWNRETSPTRAVPIGLIETWDVLKSMRLKVHVIRRIWLIETWDVLKLGFPA